MLNFKKALLIKIISLICILNSVFTAHICKAETVCFLESKPAALRVPSIFLKNSERPKSALILSHSITEKWDIGDITRDSISATVEFYAGNKSIGKAQLQLNKHAASIMTCWFKSYVQRQTLGREFAARIYLRASQLSEWLGFDTQYAHSYYYLSLNEERAVDYGANLDNIDIYDSIFETLGLKNEQLKEREGLSEGIYGNMYNQHTALLKDVLNNIRTNWINWFYIERMRRVGIPLENIDKIIKYLNVHSLIETNLTENKKALELKTSL